MPGAVPVPFGPAALSQKTLDKALLEGWWVRLCEISDPFGQNGHVWLSV